MVKKNVVVNAEQDITASVPRNVVRYKDGAIKYCMCQSTFEHHAKKAGAVIKLGKVVLVDCDIFEQYLAQFRVES